MSILLHAPKKLVAKPKHAEPTVNISFDIYWNNCIDVFRLNVYKNNDETIFYM